MLWIEKGGEKQIMEELEAYNPLIPRGNNIVFVLQLGFIDAVVRRKKLATLGIIFQNEA